MKIITPIEIKNAFEKATDSIRDLREVVYLYCDEREITHFKDKKIKELSISELFSFCRLINQLTSTVGE